MNAREYDWVKTTKEEAGIWHMAFAYGANGLTLCGLKWVTRFSINRTDEPVCETCRKRMSQ